MSWLKHRFEHEKLFHLLYAHIHAKSWYTQLVLYLMCIFVLSLLEARAVDAKDMHSAYEALFEAAHVIFVLALV